MKSIKLATVLISALAAAAAFAGDSDMQLPRIERGKVISPVPAQPAPQYPRVDGPPDSRRLYINKDVSVSGSPSPPSANVQFPYSKK